jgi:hypothetical protein
MVVHDRIERYTKIGDLLDYPFEQRPSPHQRLNQMLIEEQKMNLRLGNTSQPWALVSTTITTVSGTSEYSVTQPVSSFQQAGKVYFVVRSTGNADLPYIPINFDDVDQLDYGRMPSSGSNANLSSPESISFYRENAQDQTFKAIIQPAPREVLTYQIWFFVGSLDRAHALMNQSGIVTELTDFLDLNAAMALANRCEWRKDDDFNRIRRKEVAAGLLYQLGDIKRPGDLAYIVEKYIKNINAPRSFEMGFWND